MKENVKCTNCDIIIIVNSRRNPSKKQPFCSSQCCRNWQRENLSVKRPDGIKKCGYCNETKKLTEFYSRGNNNFASYCKPCLYKFQMKRWNDRKEDAIKYLGNKCNKCGFIGHPALFDFHHRDPSSKEFDWGKMRLKKWSLVTDELDKCDMLCCMCHRMEHTKKELWSYKQ